MRVSSDVDERTLREMYLRAFDGWSAGQAGTVMCSYNKINGVYAVQNPWLLTKVLRDERGFEGVVVSRLGRGRRPGAAVAAGLDLDHAGARPRPR